MKNASDSELGVGMDFRDVHDRVMHIMHVDYEGHLACKVEYIHTYIHPERHSNR